MTTQTEALKLALEALDFSTSPSPCVEELQDDAIAAIKEALAQPEQEPVAVVEEVSNDGYLFKQVVWKVQPHSFDYGTKFYTTPPQRKPLTRAVVWKLWCDAKFESAGFFWLVFARAIEAAHGIKE